MSIFFYLSKKHWNCSRRFSAALCATSNYVVVGLLGICCTQQQNRRHFTNLLRTNTHSHTPKHFRPFSSQETMRNLSKQRYKTYGHWMYRWWLVKPIIKAAYNSSYCRFRFVDSTPNTSYLSKYHELQRQMIWNCAATTHTFPVPKDVTAAKSEKRLKAECMGIGETYKTKFCCCRCRVVVSCRSCQIWLKLGCHFVFGSVWRFTIIKVVQ